MKEPKLLAQIRENAAHVERQAKAKPAPQPGGPQFVGSVETPDSPVPPSNYIADALGDCSTVEQCSDLLSHALQHGYSSDGQTVLAIKARLREIRSGTPKKRGAR